MNSTYARVSCIPNILEGYRYLTRRSITDLGKDVGVPYGRMRGLCSLLGVPRAGTLDCLTKSLPFITQETWKEWQALCVSAQEASNTRKEATPFEESLLGMLPQDELLVPFHLVLDVPSRLVTEFLNSNGVTKGKGMSFYTSYFHSRAITLLCQAQGLKKSELLSIMVEDRLRNSPEAMSTLLEEFMGYKVPKKVQETVEHVPPKEEVLEEEEVVGEVVLEEFEDLEFLPIEEWAPALMDPGSTLSAEEYDALFSGEDDE